MKTLHRAFVSAFLFAAAGGAIAYPACQMFQNVADAEKCGVRDLIAHNLNPVTP